LPEGGGKRLGEFGRCAAEIADHRHRLLLRTGQERICRRAGENRYEIPAPHPQLLDPTLGMDYGSTEPTPERLDECRLSTLCRHSLRSTAMAYDAPLRHSFDAYFGRIVGSPRPNAVSNRANSRLNVR